MKFIEKLKNKWKEGKYVCIGLDPVIEKIPDSIKGEDRIFEFNKAIIDSTHDLVAAFKPNSAFYEAEGARGVEQLFKTTSYIAEKYPDIVVIFDAKRADIGNTNEGGKRLLIEGSGAWKTFQVADDTTGEILHEVKFYKAEFREKVLSVPEFQGYIGDLLEAAMVMKNDENDHPSFKGADANSLEEMKRQENVE
jgi:orotidine-5'-phosphate decarboxylase